MDTLIIILSDFENLKEQLQSRNFGSITLPFVGSLSQKVCPHGLTKWTHPLQLKFFFLEAFCDISHRLGGITPYGGVFSDAFPGLKMWVTFACATAKFLTHFIISIAVLENVPPDAGLHKRATLPL
jgi:hypothetical protein